MLCTVINKSRNNYSTKLRCRQVQACVESSPRYSGSGRYFVGQTTRFGYEGVDGFGEGVGGFWGSLGSLLALLYLSIGKTSLHLCLRLA
jgi:hypothetical protein